MKHNAGNIDGKYFKVYSGQRAYYYHIHVENGKVNLTETDASGTPIGVRYDDLYSIDSAVSNLNTGAWEEVSMENNALIFN